jgi:hypothetical protein
MEGELRISKRWIKGSTRVSLSSASHLLPFILMLESCMLIHLAVLSMDYVTRYENRTLWGEGKDLTNKWGATKVLMRARPPGHGLMVPSALHRVFTACGIRDASATIEGSRNSVEVVKCAMQMLHGGVSFSSFWEGERWRIRLMRFRLTHLVSDLDLVDVGEEKIRVWELGVRRRLRGRGDDMVWMLVGGCSTISLTSDLCRYTV